MDANSQPVLCYVNKPWAYFTTKKLSEQWGDDWNDAPYEHNAGEPYDYGNHDKEKGREPWEITRIAFIGEFDAPCDHHYNSPWSVDQINAGEVPWLKTTEWSSGKTVSIPAGATLDEFCALIKEGKGSVYFEV